MPYSKGSQFYWKFILLCNYMHVVIPILQLNNLSDLIPPVITCEHTVSQSNNWRIHEQLLGKLASFVKCFTSDQIYYKFVPVLFDVLHRNVSTAWLFCLQPGRVILKFYILYFSTYCQSGTPRRTRYVYL